MNLNSLFQTCFYLTLVLLVFSLSISFISALGIFGTVESGVDVDIEDADETTDNVFGMNINMSVILTAVTSSEGIASLAGLGATVGMAILTRSPTLIGVGLFSTLFWTSYIHTANVISVGGFIPVGLIIISSVIVVFLWIGAIIGMITGSG